MIYDRDYFRSPPRNPVKASMVLLWILLGCFAIQCAFWLIAREDLILRLGLSRHSLGRWEVWRLLTYQLLHEVPWPLHVLSNVLGLYFLGPTVEERLGSRRFLAIYLTGGLVGGLAQVAYDLLRGSGPDVVLVGASAGVSAISAVFCRLFADESFTLAIIAFPVRMRARVFLWLLIAGSVIGLLFPGGRVAHMAHLGGIAVGWFGALGLEGLPGSGLLDRLRFLKGWSARKTSTPTVRPSRRAPVEAVSRKREDPDRQQQEVDAILEKISAHGLQSLTDADRKVLEAARRRISGK